jgi:hypothetical protein
MADASTIDTLRSQFQSRLAAAATERALKTIDDEFLSRKAGSVTALMQALKSLPQEERRAFGAAVNALKTEIESARTRATQDQQWAPHRGDGRDQRPSGHCRRSWFASILTRSPRSLTVRVQAEGMNRSRNGPRPSSTRAVCPKGARIP